MHSTCGGVVALTRATKVINIDIDDALWRTLCALLGEPPADGHSPDAHARQLAFLPASLGGLGLVASARIAPAAYWASWADSLPCLAQRQPAAAHRCLAELQRGSDAAAPCLCEAAAASTELDAAGWTQRPPWDALLHGAAPDRPDAAAEPGLWAHGWQRPAALALHHAHRERVLLPDLPPASQALLRSQAAAWLIAIPHDEGLTLPPHYMHCALRRRLRLPLAITSARCGGVDWPGCGRPLDPLGDHAAACPRSGALARRAHVLEHAWVRVAREAVGPEGRVVPQQWLAHTNAAGVSHTDRRRLDLVIHGASPSGQAFCCDATLVSPLSRTGAPVHGAAARDGAALRAAEERKRRRYPEVCAAGPQRLLVLGTEVGGRWSPDALHLVRRLLRLRACRAPPSLRAAAAAGWSRRWWGLLSTAAQKAVCSTLLGGPWLAPALAHGDAGPPLADVLGEAPPFGPSLLPLRG